MLWSNLAGLVVAVAGAVALSDTASPADLTWGAAAGVCGGVATVCLYRALATGAMSVVAPVSAAVGAALPVLVGILGQGSPSTLVLAGLVSGLAAIPLVSLGTASATPARGALVLAVVSGLGLGGFLVLLSHAGHAQSLWPLVAARCTSIPLVAAMAYRTAAGFVLPGGARRPALLSGALDMTSNVLFVMATWSGQLATVALLTSLYPASTVLLAHTTLGERIRPAQRVGMLLALGSLVLVALD
ncbi:EamA family transporter [Lentzea kentuckyensis]|uniref:EamA family transporter n=1 Tax=Lentzea kentuckyensis TaxID=360086 RepID=UPI00117AE979|nr:EamA family transporter [Lentzea kentuckyensis]